MSVLLGLDTRALSTLNDVSN